MGTSTFRSIRTTSLFAFGIAAFLGASLTGCGTTISLGDANDSNATSGNTNDAGTGVLGNDSGTSAIDYAWSWVSPAPTGVHLRAVFELSANEKWIVGDGGAVVHQVGTTATNLRVGTPEEVLSSVWASGESDVWVGGIRGTNGLITHWDGVKWTEFPIASEQVRAIDGIPGGDIFAVIGTRAVRVESHGIIITTYSSSARDIWVQSSNDIWIVGDGGVTHWDGHGNLTATSSTTPAISVWGDKNAHVYTTSISTGCLVVTDYNNGTSSPVGDPMCAHQQAPRGDFIGKQLVGDASGNLLVLLHSEPPSDFQREGYALHAPSTTTWDEHEQKLSDRILGLGAAPNASFSFAGMTGYRGTFVGASPIAESASFRDDFTAGAPAADGTAFAIAAGPAVWSEEKGWSALPALPTGYYSGAGAAGSANDLWIGGFTEGTPSNPYLATYYALHWNGSAWSVGPNQTEYMFRPLWAGGANDTWAASDYKLVHYDGSKWETRLTGGPGTGGIQAANGLSTNDVYFIDELAGLYHWDGLTLKNVSGLPTGLVTLDSGAGLLIEAKDGTVWTVGISFNTTSEYAQYESIMHFAGGVWKEVQVPGLDIQALAEGPDGKMRMLARPSNYGVQAAGTNESIYTIDDRGISQELAVPSIQLETMFRSGAYLYALGLGGATLRLEPKSSTSVP